MALVAKFLSQCPTNPDDKKNTHSLVDILQELVFLGLHNSDRAQGIALLLENPLHHVSWDFLTIPELRRLSKIPRIKMHIFKQFRQKCRQLPWNSSAVSLPGAFSVLHESGIKQLVLVTENFLTEFPASYLACWYSGVAASFRLTSPLPFYKPFLTPLFISSEHRFSRMHHYIKGAHECLSQLCSKVADPFDSEFLLELTQQLFIMLLNEKEPGFLGRHGITSDLKMATSYDANLKMKAQIGGLYVPMENFGLPNPGSTSCYVTSSLQCMFAMEEFPPILENMVKLTKEVPGKLTKDMARKTLMAQKLLDVYNTRNTSAFSDEKKKTMSDFCASFKKSSTALGGAEPRQEDAHEFVVDLLSMLDEIYIHVTPENHQSVTQQLFGFKIKWTRKCTSCNDKTDNVDYMTELILRPPVGDKKQIFTLEQLVTSYFAEHPDDETVCNLCGEKGFSVHGNFEYFPKYLTLVFARFGPGKTKKVITTTVEGKKQKEQMYVAKRINNSCRYARSLCMECIQSNNRTVDRSPGEQLDIPAKEEEHIIFYPPGNDWKQQALNLFGSDLQPTAHIAEPACGFKVSCYLEGRVLRDGGSHPDSVYRALSRGICGTDSLVPSLKEKSAAYLEQIHLTSTDDEATQILKSLAQLLKTDIYVFHVSNETTPRWRRIYSGISDIGAPGFIYLKCNNERRYMWVSDLQESVTRVPIKSKLLPILDACGIDCPDMHKDTVYNLHSAVLHQSKKAKRGHYKAVIHSALFKSWVLCNDSIIQPCTEKDVYQHVNDIYITFYKLIQ